LSAIEAVGEDLVVRPAHGPAWSAAMWDSGRPKWRLRAAFIAAGAGKQVAVVVPTTLLARQHHATFRGALPRLCASNVAQASRMVGSKLLSETKKGLADADRWTSLMGTHALLSKSIQFSNLGLVIIDEEQHFGVAHKERLKEMRSSVHVLTLSATPPSRGRCNWP
jgi:transcription-repair coupling factor (superfamily II helicase)